MTNDASPFDIEPAFYLEDNRAHREVVPVTKETLEAKLSTLLPDWIVAGKSVLDLGSCLGATGHWCLSRGASKYTGVEIQQEYFAISENLLSRHWPKERYQLVRAEVSEFLDQVPHDEYDIVVLMGVLFVFLDYYSVLKKIAATARQWVMIEASCPKTAPLLPIVQLARKQNITLPNGNERATGVGSHITPTALAIVMDSLGFESSEGELHPRAPQSGHDAFNEIPPNCKTPARYLMRFINRKVKRADLAEELKTGRFLLPKGVFDPYVPGEKLNNGSWKFDNKTAENFQQIAATSIPGYDEVIEMCVRVARKVFPDRQCRVLDIGSALGHTVDVFLKEGFGNSFGVENSSAMLELSKHQDRIFLSDRFPTGQGPFDFICANWVLHFMQDRKIYLEDAFTGLTAGGYMIITDKTRATPLIRELYHDFKRAKGLTEAEIRTKETALQGVLDPYPVEWYLIELNKLGFESVHIINAHPHFTTFLCKK